MNKYLAEFTHFTWLANMLVVFEALERPDAESAAKSYAQLLGLEFVSLAQTE